MLLALAWKNIWRNKTRSLIILSAFAVGLVGGLLACGVSFGMADQMTKSAIETSLAHIQIHNPGFAKDHVLTMAIPRARSLADSVEQLTSVKAVAARVVVSAMAASPTTATGVEMLGVDPAREQLISDVAASIVEGGWFGNSVRNPAVVGQELAKKLDIGIGSKIVFTFQDTGGTLTGGAFRIVGLFKTVSSTFDKSTVFVPEGDLIRLIGNDTLFQEMAVLLKSQSALDATVEHLSNIAPHMRVETWKELSPDLAVMSETINETLAVFMVVILVALAFGIVNTMLMVVLERRRELAMLMAVGMPRRTIFGMIVLETITLSLTGAFAGMIMTLGLMAVLSTTGINLSLFARGLHALGIAERLYPTLPWTMYPVLAAMVVVTAVVSAIFPALKTLGLKPAQALRAM